MADQNQSPDNIYDDEFDGLAAEEERSVRKVEDDKTETVFGFPLNLDVISPSVEFDPTENEKTRTVVDMDIRQPEPQPVEFDVGASFCPKPSLFALSSPPSKVLDLGNQVPTFPFYLKPAKTSFQTQKLISVLKPEIELMFAKNAVSYSIEPNSPFFYDCSIVSLRSLVEFEVRFFSLESKLLVEFRHLAGCHYGFGEAYKKLAAPFASVKISASKPPPLFLDDADFAMPTLQKSSASVVDHEMKLLSPDMDLQTQIDGARGLASSSDEMDFSDDGLCLPLANRLTELASSKTENDELRVVAFGSIAKLTTLDNISKDWLNGTVNTIMEGVKDDHPHVRREALQSLKNSVERDKSLATKFVRAGVVPFLEHEEAGGSEEQSPDFVAQSIAQQALLACRA